MNLKKLMLSLLGSVALVASAQTQGYLDGVEYYKTGRYDNAAEILEKTLNEPATDRATALYYLGAVALRNGDTATARKNFDEGIALAPKNGLNYVGLGAIELKNGNAKAAADQFKAATKAQNKAPILVAVARAYYEADPVAYAKEYQSYLSKAADKDKKEPDVYVLKGDILRDEAIAMGEQGGSAKIGEAASEYLQAIHFDPNSPEAYVKYSRIYATVQPQYAIDKVVELTRIAPNSAMAQRELAERYYDSGQWTRAAQQYGEYIKNPNHFIQDEERYAVLLYFGERYDESLDLSHKILAKNPESLQMKRMLFLNLEKKGDYEGAKKAADEFFASQLPEGVNFTANDYTTYAGILNKLEDYEGEVAALEKAFVVNPDKLELLKDISAAYSQDASRARKAGDDAAAHADYVRAYEAYKRYIDAGQYVTNDLVEFGNRAQNAAGTSELGSEERLTYITAAIDAIDKVIERVPDNYIPYRNKARMLLVKNDNKGSQEQIDAYAKMVEIFDQDPANKEKRADLYREAYTRTAAYYMEQDDKDNAKLWYEKLLEMDPDNAELKEFIETRF